ncbi:hypothetical protein CDL15_Pgr000370 [Punica granatum]|uniref:Prostatic spermine-binding protein-like n=1 Tax=Punica granatum TaxID=22663 RepID=A0A218XSM2_PUNGR|nr:hypothetical protein CDL15_Pgr000370 [Punica granatum]
MLVQSNTDFFLNTVFDEDDNEDDSGDDSEDEEQDENAWEFEYDGFDGLDDSDSDDRWVLWKDGDEDDDCTGDDHDAGKVGESAAVDKIVEAVREVAVEEAGEKARKKVGEETNRYN